MQMLKGISGLTYEAEIYPMSELGSFDDLDGVEAVYMFARLTLNAQTQKRKIKAVYIGETKNVHKRLREEHHRMVDIRERKATLIIIHRYRDEEDALLKTKWGRGFIENDLIQRYRPECQRKKWDRKRRRARAILRLIEGVRA